MAGVGASARKIRSQLVMRQAPRVLHLMRDNRAFKRRCRICIGSQRGDGVAKYSATPLANFERRGHRSPLLHPSQHGEYFMRCYISDRLIAKRWITVDSQKAFNLLMCSGSPARPLLLDPLQRYGFKRIGSLSLRALLILATGGCRVDALAHQFPHPVTFCTCFR